MGNVLRVDSMGTTTVRIVYHLITLKFLVCEQNYVHFKFLGISGQNDEVALLPDQHYQLAMHVVNATQGVIDPLRFEILVRDKEWKEYIPLDPTCKRCKYISIPKNCIKVAEFD